MPVSTAFISLSCIEIVETIWSYFNAMHYNDYLQKLVTVSTYIEGKYLVGSFLPVKIYP